MPRLPDVCPMHGDLVERTIRIEAGVGSLRERMDDGLAAVSARMDDGLKAVGSRLDDLASDVRAERDARTRLPAQLVQPATLKWLVALVLSFAVLLGSASLTDVGALVWPIARPAPLQPASAGQVDGAVVPDDDSGLAYVRRNARARP